MESHRIILELQDRIKQFIGLPAQVTGRGQRLVRYLLRLGWFGGQKLVRDRAPLLAGALSYQTLLSLVPVLILFFLAVHTFVPEQQIRQRIHKLVFDTMNLGAITTQGTVVALETGSIYWSQGMTPLARAATTEWLDESDSELETLMAQSNATGGAVPTDVAAWISDLVDSTENKIRNQSAGASVTVVSVAFLVMAGLSIFSTIGLAFNRIWEVPRGQSYFRLLRSFVTTIMLAALVLGVAVWAFDFVNKFSGPRSVLWLGARILPLAVSCLAFFILYKVFPNVQVPTMAALAGAVVGGILWEFGAKLGFEVYLRYATGATQLYGNLALIPVFMLWLWLSWLMVLLGAEVAYVVQHMEDLTREQVAKNESHFLRPDLLALAVMAMIGQRFTAHGVPPTRLELSEAVGVNERDVGAVLDCLEQQGFVRAAGAVNRLADSQPEYLPARPLDQMTAAQVIAVGEKLEPLPAEGSQHGGMLKWARGYLATVSEQVSATLGNVTVQTLARMVETSLPVPPGESGQLQKK